MSGEFDRHVRSVCSTGEFDRCVRSAYSFGGGRPSARIIRAAIGARAVFGPPAAPAGVAPCPRDPAMNQP
ncbi:hypothetical protein DF060_08625 [Burkholderia pseudomallei]|nr:hypothetical protein BOC36_29310 [Burkholderia pseudomallei]EES22019.1 hypothetical protein BURPS1106B_0589 [Burkholderia pseudomallei 1106b]ARK60685.1 hypothetical protein BOC37_12735 [Burkholderia pseudomallei]ARK71909.1 hypothetical protein BOC38_36850 [Burkholderia pseudomallei]ARK72503.1 hypothetical protein BOC39_01465 [Burkholderia pseudomallei]